MKVKILIVLAMTIAVLVLLPRYESTHLKATLTNDQGKTVYCEANWSGLNFGEPSADAQYDECINGYVAEGYAIRRNERNVEKVGAQWLR